MRPHQPSALMVLLAALAAPTFADPAARIEVTGTVELAPPTSSQPDLARLLLRTPEGKGFVIGGYRGDEPGFYANFVGRTITVRGRLSPASQGSWSGEFDSLHTGIREGDNPNDYSAPYAERAPMVSPALTVFEGVVDGSVLRSPTLELELVGPVADLVRRADGRSVAVKGYAFPADAPTELFVVAVRGTVTSATRYREVTGKKRFKLARRGRNVWVQGTAASGAPADPIKNIRVRPALNAGELGGALLVDKALLKEWDGPGLVSACVIVLPKLWWSSTTFLAYVGTYLPSSAVEIGQAAEPTQGLSSLGQ